MCFVVQHIPLFLILLFCFASSCAFHTLFVRQRCLPAVRTTTYLQSYNKSKREDEIRRKIIKLKKEGKIGSNNSKNTKDGPDILQEQETPQKKDISSTGSSSQDASLSSEYSLLEQLRRSREREGKSSILTQQYQDKLFNKQQQQKNSKQQQQQQVEEEEEEDDTNTKEDGEDELLERVAQKWEEKIGRSTNTDDVHFVRDMDEKEKQYSQLYGYKGDGSKEDGINEDDEKNDGPKPTTTGVGGTWTKTQDVGEIYKPSRGSWGAFPRPKDISKAYGGGRRVDPIISEENLKKSEEETREKLRAYREKAGIVVESEIQHADQIEEALTLSNRAMLRGVYAAAVSVLEKVTPFCSTNSKTGGKVFLELAMAYEAVGRTEEAIAVYSKLTQSRIEDIKFNAKRLLYGIEAMQFMRNEVRASSFSRKKVSQEFIDLTGFNNMSEKFDNAYATAYVDVDKANYYKRLSASVVRSYREARLVLLMKAGDIDRLRIVQALRYMNRDFESALRAEKEKSPGDPDVFVPLMNGAPIVAPKERDGDTNNDLSFGGGESSNMDTFRLGGPDQMLDNLNGEWRLQLFADKSGDGVKFFNSTVAWQKIDSSSMEFTCFLPATGLPMMTAQQRKGSISFDRETRTIQRDVVNTSFLSSFLAASVPAIQIISVDSELCITRTAGRKASDDANAKEYFAVWKRVEPGTFVPTK